MLKRNIKLVNLKYRKNIVFKVFLGITVKKHISDEVFFGQQPKQLSKKQNEEKTQK